MTTDNGATAGAVAEVEVTEEQTEGQVTDATLEALESAGQEAEGEAAVAEESDADPSEPTFELILPEGAEAEASPEPELPGKSLDDLQREEDQRRVQNYATLMMNGETSFVTTARRLGMNDDQIREAWQTFRQPLQAIHKDNEVMNKALRERAVQQALPEDEFQTFSSRQYEGRKQEVEALVAIGEARANKRWSQALWNQKTPEDVKKFHESAQKKQFDKGRGQGESTQDVADTGQSVNGSAPSRGRKYKDLSAEQRGAMSPAERDAYIARHG